MYRYYDHFFIILLSFENYKKAINDFSTTISNKTPPN